MQSSTHNKRSQRFGPYQVGETVGRGTFGKVKIALHETTHVRVALKILPRKVVEATAHSALKLKREIKILKVLRHPHICRLYDVVQTKHDIVLVLEYVSGGELFDYINRRGSIEEHQARMMFQQLAAAVAYCHRYRVTHRDIKPENILLEHDSPHSVKLSDFGLSSITHDGRFFDTSCGTPNYASPEVVRGLLYDGPATDVWSCGVVLYAMLCGCLPFDDESVTTLFKKIRTADYVMPRYLSSEVQDLLQRMLVVDPLHRATMEQVMQHPWLRPNYPPYLLTLHYQAVLETRRFARERAFFHEPLDEEVVNVLSVRFQTSPQVIVTNIITEEEKLTPTMFAVFSEEHPESVRRYPAAVYFETFSNALDSKLWPTPLEIRPAEVALRDEGHDVYVSYLILTEKKRARMCQQEMDKSTMNMSASSFLQSQSAQGYGSLNAHSLHQVSGNTSFTGSSFKESLTSLNKPHDAPLSTSAIPSISPHTHTRLNQTSFGNISLSLVDKELKAAATATTSSSNDNTATIAAITKETASHNKLKCETNIDRWLVGYNEVAAPFLPLCHKRARHTLLGRHFGIVELPVELLQAREIELIEQVQYQRHVANNAETHIASLRESDNNTNECVIKTIQKEEKEQSTLLLRPQKKSNTVLATTTTTKTKTSKPSPSSVASPTKRKRHGKEMEHIPQEQQQQQQQQENDFKRIPEQQECVHSSLLLLHPVTHMKKKNDSAIETDDTSVENCILYFTKDVMPFGNDFMRNGVAFCPSTSHETLEFVYACLKEEGLLWRPIFNFCFSCVRYPNIKLQVKMYKVEADLQVVDVKISVQSGMAAVDVAMSLLERLRQKAVTMKMEKTQHNLVQQREMERLKATVSAVDAAVVASVLNEEIDDASNDSVSNNKNNITTNKSSYKNNNNNNNSSSSISINSTNADNRINISHIDEY